MNLVWNAMKSVVKIAYWKCRYASCIRIPWVQGFDRVHIELSKDAKMCFGRKNQNRGELHLICENGGRLELGSHIFCNTGVCISAMGYIKIGDYCKFGNHLVIVDHDHNFREQGEEYAVGEITIGERVWIGANCTVLKNVHIGNDCVIAAGCVVKEDIPDGMLCYQKKETICVPLKKGQGKGTLVSEA